VSHKTFALNIMGDQDLALNQVFNYPNPMRIGASTRFYWMFHAHRQAQFAPLLKFIRFPVDLSGFQ